MSIFSSSLFPPSRRPIWLALFLSPFIAGCQPSIETRRYDVYLSNHLPDPITVFLTKDGPPDERGWLSPEQMAAGPINQDANNVGQTVLARQGLDIESVRGRFWHRTSAILRVYRQTGELEDFAAIEAANPKRLDIHLDPGPNHLIIGENQWGLSVQREK